MIYIDDRIGSGELLPLFQSHRAHSQTPASIRRLPAADFCFVGNGPKGPVVVGIERKSIRNRRRDDGFEFRDALQSIGDGRLSGEQLPNLTKHYEFVYVVLEGLFRTNVKSGFLEEWTRDGWTDICMGQSPFLASRLWNALETISWTNQVRVIHTPDAQHTVEEVYRLHQYFNHKEWEEHRAHLGLHRSAETVSLTKASSVRRFAHSLTGLGWTKSGEVEKHFRSIDDVVNAGIELTEEQRRQSRIQGPKEYAKMEGFGPKMAQRLWKELHGEYEPD